MSVNLKIFIIVLLSAVIVTVSPFLGIKTIALSDIAGANGQAGHIFYNMRLPRVITAFFTGGILAAGGLVFQALFKNPIATPFTLGVASGASMGAASYFYLGFSSITGIFFGETVFAMLGALLTISAVYGISAASGRNNGANILLAGVAISFFCSAVIMFMQYFSDLSNSYKITHFMIGSLASSNINSAIYIMPPALIGFFIILIMNRELDIIATGNDIASSRGVNTKRTVNILYFTVSLMLAVTVAICGPIGFVGMMIPHICRMIIGSANRRLIPVSFISGGAFLTLCDTGARIAIAPAELPVGVITSILGAPFFIFLILKNR